MGVRGSGADGAAIASTTLADIVAIARAAKLFVSGDTGPLHIAGATATPIVRSIAMSFDRCAR